MRLADVKTWPNITGNDAGCRMYTAVVGFDEFTVNWYRPTSAVVNETRKNDAEFESGVSLGTDGVTSVSGERETWRTEF
jgi:hypothetical protein